MLPVVEADIALAPMQFMSLSMLLASHGVLLKCVPAWHAQTPGICRQDLGRPAEPCLYGLALPSNKCSTFGRSFKSQAKCTRHQQSMLVKNTKVRHMMSQSCCCARPLAQGHDLRLALEIFCQLCKNSLSGVAEVTACLVYFQNTELGEILQR